MSMNATGAGNSRLSDYICNWHNEGGERMNASSFFTSKTDEWATPDDFFEKYDRIYHFQLDVCATPENAKCARYFTKADDGLSRDWNVGGCVWMNPPYGRSIIDWMRKAYETSLQGTTVVCLLPARTDTRWWHEYAMRGDIEFIRGRLRFGDGANSAPFPSAVVCFGARR